MTDTTANATTDTTVPPNTQLLDDHSLDTIVAGVDCSTALKLQKAYYAAGDALRAAGQSWAANALEGTGRGIVYGGCH